MPLFDPVFLTRAGSAFDIVSTGDYEELSLSAGADEASFEQYTMQGGKRVFFALRPVDNVTVSIRNNDGTETTLGDDNGGYDGYLFPCIGRIDDLAAFNSKVSALTGKIEFVARDDKGNEAKYSLLIYPSVDDDTYLQMVADILRINRLLAAKASEVETSTQLFEVNSFTQLINRFCDAVKGINGNPHVEIKQNEIRIPERKLKRFNVRTVSDLNMGKNKIRTSGYIDSFDNYENRMVLLYVKYFELLCDYVKVTSPAGNDADEQLNSKKDELLSKWHDFQTSDEYTGLMDYVPQELAEFKYDPQSNSLKVYPWRETTISGKTCKTQYVNVSITDSYAREFFKYIKQRIHLHADRDLTCEEWEGADEYLFYFSEREDQVFTPKKNSFCTCIEEYKYLYKVVIKGDDAVLAEISLRGFLEDYENITLESSFEYQQLRSEVATRKRREERNEVRKELFEKLASLEHLNVFQNVPLRKETLKGTNTFLYNKDYRRCFDVMKLINKDLIKDLSVDFEGDNPFAVGKCVDIYEVWCLIKMLDVLVNKYGFMPERGLNLPGLVEDALSGGDSIKDLSVNLTNRSINPDSPISVRVDYNVELHSIVNAKTKLPDIRVKISYRGIEKNFCFDSKFRNIKFANWFEDIKVVAYGKYLEWVDNNLDEGEKTAGSYILHSIREYPVYLGFKRLDEVENAITLDQEEKAFLEGHPMLGSIPLLPQSDEDEYDNMCLAFRMIMEYYYGLSDHCWICGSGNIIRTPNNKGGGIHEVCMDCGEFWVKTHCHDCHENLVKHYKNYYELDDPAKPWNVKCPSCGKSLPDNMDDEDA